MEDTLISSKHKIKKKQLSYIDAGVDIKAGNTLVNEIKPLALSTYRKGVLSDLGGFGGLFDLKAAGYLDPILIAGTDGVGTKCLIAKNINHFNGIGIDLVAMCVNDIIVQGAEPLLFLDYFATSKLDIKQGKEIISSIAEGCKLAKCALLGGETAEMPDLYSPNDFDLAGFCLGAVDRDKLITGKKVIDGDIVLGLGSSGLHSNGFSLVRKVMELNGMSYLSTAPFDSNQTLGMAFLKPTRIYVNSCLTAIKEGGVHALAHVTGGGLIENIPRILPKNLGVCLDCNSWSVSSLFTWLSNIGNISPEEMFKTFNCGLGMIIVADHTKSLHLKKVLEECGESIFEIGSVKKIPVGSPQVELENIDSPWIN